MRSIKHALTERYYTWEDAVEVAMSDPEIDLLDDNGQVYKPSAYEDEVEGDWAQSKPETLEAGQEVKGEPVAATDKEATR